MDDDTPLAMLCWDDIETAPRDRPVLVGRFDAKHGWKFICMAQWVNDNQDNTPKRAGWYAFGGYYDTGGVTQSRNTRGERVSFPADKKIQGLLSIAENYQPTHWTPITKPDGSDFTRMATGSFKKYKQDDEIRSGAVRNHATDAVRAANAETIALMILRESTTSGI